jgi:SAM-dependent methyltransferase
MKYIFKEIKQCEMCNDESNSHYKIGQRFNKSQGLFPRKKTGLTVTVNKCSNCGLIYSNPMPIPLDILDHYGVPPKDYWKPEYFNILPDIEYLKSEVAKYIDIHASPKVLDIGSGIGKMMKAFIDNGFDAYGIEPSPSFIEMAVNKMKIPKERLQCVQVEDAEFEENFFDLITFGAVFEHLYHPSIALKRVLRWLRPGGLVKITVPSSNWLTSKIFNLWYRLSFQDYCTNLSPMHTPYHLYEFSLKSFRKNAELNGYEIVGVHYGICDTFLPRIFDKIIKPIMKKTNTGMEIYLLLRKPL